VFPSYPKATEVTQPRQRAFHSPTVLLSPISVSRTHTFAGNRARRTDCRPNGLNVGAVFQRFLKRRFPVVYVSSDLHVVGVVRLGQPLVASIRRTASRNVRMSLSSFLVGNRSALDCRRFGLRRRNANGTGGVQIPLPDANGESNATQKQRRWTVGR
jgi:hypothetical protein